MYIPGKSIIKLIFLFLITFMLSGCAKALVEVTVVDQRTALENQILGSYGELDKDVLLLASVRSIDESGKLIKVSPIPPNKKKVIRAMQRSSFNKDDIDKFKTEKIIGENNNGLLSIVKADLVSKEKKDFLNNLVIEENIDREIVMQRLIDTNEELTVKDMKKVQKVFASLNRDKAKPGEMIQLEDGEWVEKKKRD